MTAESLLQFWNQLVIERVDGSIGPYGASAAPFQRRFLSAVSPALSWLASPGDAPPPECWWYWGQRHRGGSKSTDAIVAVLPVLLTSPIARRIVVLSTDADAGRVLIQIAAKIVSLNPALRARLRVDKWRVANIATGSEVEIMSNDAGSFYGQLPDAIVADEICHWPSESLWESLASTLPKKKHLLLIVLSNAGWLDSWQRRVFESMLEVPHAMVDVMSGTSPWVSKEQLAVQRRLLPPSTYQRLWENQWVAAGGDLLTEAQLDRAIVWDKPLSAREAKHGISAIGCDIAVAHDHASIVVVVGSHGDGKLRVARVQNFPPPVRLEYYRDSVLRLARQYGVTACFLDSWQALRLSEELSAAGMLTVPQQQTGLLATRQSEALLQAFGDESLQLYSGNDGDLLIHDLRHARITERPYGHAIALPRDSTGHGDRLSALLQCLPACLEALGRVGVVSVVPDGPTNGRGIPLSWCDEIGNQTYWP